MMKHPLLSRFGRLMTDSHTYFAACGEDLSRSNWAMYRQMTVLYLLCMLVYLLLVCLPSGVASQTHAVLAGIVCHGLLILFTLPHRSMKEPLVSVVLLIFGLEIMALTIWLGTAVFPQSSALLFPLMLVMMSQIYTLPPRVTLSLLLGSAGCFLLLGLLLKPLNVLSMDAVSIVTALTVALVSYLTSLHYKVDAYLTRQELHHLCTLDPMTGMLNKAAFQACCNDYLRTHGHAVPYALAVIDLDFFKQVNDRYGHKTGDDVILAFAELLPELLETDAPPLVGRFGGDEFVVLFQQSISSQTVRTRLLDLVESMAPQLTERFGFPVTCSVGAVVTDRQDQDFIQLFRTADQAMYAVKDDGGNAVAVVEQFTPSRRSS